MTVQPGDLRLYTEVAYGIDFYLILSDGRTDDPNQQVLRFESYLRTNTLHINTSGNDPLVSSPEEWMP